MDTIPTPKTFIYALADPTTGEVRYIGKSVNPQRRLQSHACEAKYATCTTYRYSWLRSLAKRHLRPHLVILQECDGTGADEERFHISFARHIGCHLVNGTDGGEGLPGWKPSPETLARMSAAATQHNAARRGIPRSPEVVAKIKETREQNKHRHKKRDPDELRRLLDIARTMRRFGPETRAKLSASAKARIARDPEAHRKMTETSIEKAIQAARSPEAKAKRLESRKSYRYPEEVRAKIAKSLTGKKQSPETIAKRSAAMTGRRNPRPLGWVMSPSHRAALSAINKGKKLSAETIERMKQAQAVRFAETPMSNQTRERIADTLRASGASRGENNPAARITEKDVRDIRRRHEAGERLSAIASAFGISKAAAWRIVKRVSWSHIE
jgi:hypothetical protein